MDYMTFHWKMSVAGMRLAGYMIETQCRVAQVLGQAALHSSSAWVVKPSPSPAQSIVRAQPKAERPKPKRAPSAPPPMPGRDAPDLRVM